MLSRIMWGTGLENALVMEFPFYDIVTDREWREGSEIIQVGSIDEAWRTGSDYTLVCEARWIRDGGDVYSPVSGALGWQSFLDWARDANAFRFVPDETVPDFYIDNCYLVEPRKGHGALTADIKRKTAFKIRNATMDFHQALRGIMFEYAPGASLTDPVAATFARTGAVGPFVGLNKLAGNALANVLRDRHYPLFPTSMQRATLLEAAGTNLIENGDYEADTVGSVLEGGATLTRDNAQAFSGSWALKVTTTNTAGSGLHWTKRDTTRIPAAAATAYTFSTWVYVTAAKTFRWDLDWYNAGGGVISTDIILGVATVTGWQRVTTTKTSPALTASVVPAFRTDGAQGVFNFWVDVVQVEASAFATSAIPTGTGAVARSNDDFSYLWTLPPSRMANAWFLADFIEQGTTLGAANERVFAIAPAGGWVAPGFVCNINSGAQQYGFQHHDGSTNPQSIAAVTPTIGQRVQILCLVNNGTPIIRVSVNGGADVVGGAAGNAPLAASYGAQAYLQIGKDPGAGTAIGTMGLIRFKSGVTPFGGITRDTIAKALAA